MWETSADVLNMSLAIGVGVVSFLLVFAVFYLIMILRDMSYTTHHIRETAETLETYVKTPARVAWDIYKGVKDVMGWVKN